MRHGMRLVLLLSAACGGSGRAGDAIATRIDSTGDSVVVTITGDVPAADIRHLVPEVVIAPGIDDTTLFTRVYEFDVDGAGRFWVYDRGSNGIFQFGPDGALIRRIGREGSGPGEFHQNGGMVTLPGNGLAEWDSQNSRISFFDSAGTFISQWPVPGGFATNEGLVTDRSGQLYLRRPVTEPREGEILGRMGLVRLADGGAYADSLVPPDLPVERRVYVAEVNGGRSSTSTNYAPALHWSWQPTGGFATADGGHGTIVIERPGASPIVVHRAASAVAIPPAERDYEERRVFWAMRQNDPAWSWKGAPVPEAKAPISGLRVARDGRIWVKVAVASEDLPEAERPTYSDSTIPIPAFRTPPVYEVYSPDGRLLGRVALPPRAELVDADGDLVWGLDRDQDDMPAVTRYRITPGLGGG